MEAYKMYDMFRNLIAISMCYKGETYLYQYDTKSSLPKGSKLILGFDTDDKRTGFCVKRFPDRKLICMIDFTNKGLPNVEIYHNMIRVFLTNICRGAEIELIVIEKPFGGFKYSFRKLTEFLGFIKGLRYQIPEWSKAEFGECLNNQWKSRFLTSQDYTGRHVKEEVKYAVREEVCIRSPEVHNYVYGVTPKTPEGVKGKPPDSCDAYGLIDGYMALVRTSSGDTKVNKTMSKSLGKVCHQIVKLNLQELKENGNTEYYLEAIKSCTNGALGVAQHRGYIKMLYLEEVTDVENISRACSKETKVVVIPIPFGPLYAIYMWERSETIKSGETYFIVGFRENI